MNEPQPSSSDFNSEAVDETLENFARALKLTKNNVKNIIYHILTDEDLYATLLGYDKQNAPYLKLTRSKWKEIQRSVQAKLDFNLRPVTPPKDSFLFQEFNEDDDDPDYMPVPSPVGDKRDLQLFEQNYRPERESRTLTTNDFNFINFDNDYYNFIDDTIHNRLYDDDDNDIEYDILKDLQEYEEEDEYFEYRNDKSTRISKDEMADLWKDFEIDIHKNSMNLNPPLPSPNKLIIDNNDGSNNFKRNLRFADDNYFQSMFEELEETNPKSPPTLMIEIGENDPLTVPPKGAQNDVTPLDCVTTEQTDKSNELKSCELTSKPLKITKKEWKIMKQQAEMLIQLLTQTCLINAHEDDTQSKCAFNKSAELITTLINESRNGNPIFKNTMIEDACDLVFDYKEKLPKIMNVSNFPVNEDDEKWFPHCIKYAISISKVFKYPKLMILNKKNHLKNDYFSPGEQMLLALGLTYFKKIPLARKLAENGKYQHINQYLLPFKTPLQIRVHIKNSKRSNRLYDTKLGKILYSSANGDWNPNKDSVFFNFTRSDYLPVDWPNNDQPPWLQKLSKCRIYRKYADCIFAAYLVRNNQLVSAGSHMLGGNFLNPILLPLQFSDSLPKGRLIIYPTDSIIKLSNVLQLIPNAIESI